MSDGSHGGGPREIHPSYISRRASIMPAFSHPTVVVLRFVRTFVPLLSSPSPSLLMPMPLLQSPLPLCEKRNARDPGRCCRGMPEWQRGGQVQGAHQGVRGPGRQAQTDPVRRFVSSSSFFLSTLTLSNDSLRRAPLSAAFVYCRPNRIHLVDSLQLISAPGPYSFLSLFWNRTFV